MLMVREMTSDECAAFLARTRLARLACAKDGQPYVVPVHVAYYELTMGDACLFGFSMAGQKIEWMRANPLVCLEFDEITNLEQWISVAVFGRFKELADGADDGWRGPTQMTPIEQSSDFLTERQLAHRVLESRGIWWEPATSAALSLSSDSSGQLTSIFYKISIDRMTGRQATPAADAPTG